MTEDPHIGWNAVEPTDGGILEVAAQCRKALDLLCERIADHNLEHDHATIECPSGILYVIEIFQTLAVTASMNANQLFQMYFCTLRKMNGIYPEED